MKYGFGVDLGGTTVKIAYFDENGTLLSKWEIPTVTENNGAQILPDIAAAIDGYIQENQIDRNDLLGIGIGAYLADNRPQKNARQMFEQAHALHKAGKWWASTELLKETMKVSSDAMVLNIIGKNCQALGEYKEAEE